MWIKLQVTLITLFAALQPAITKCWTKDSYRICQTPEDTAYLGPPRTQIIFSVSSNDSDFESLKLQARLDSSTIQENYVYEGEDFQFCVIYNSCTSSNEPTNLCKEVQVTFWGENITFGRVSFHLRQSVFMDTMLSSLSLEVQPPTETPTGTSTTKPASRGGATNAPGATQANNASESGTEPTSNPLPHPIGLIACALAGLFFVMFLITLIILIVTCKQRKSQKQAKNGSREEVV